MIHAFPKWRAGLSLRESFNQVFAPRASLFCLDLAESHQNKIDLDHGCFLAGMPDPQMPLGMKTLLEDH